jgi:hypothetical protein
MHKISRCLIVVAMLGAASSAEAQELKISMANGRVTLVATDVPLRQILAEWARIGDTRIVNGDKLSGPPLTLQLVDYPEGRALDVLLREAAGYMAAPRGADRPGASMYDRILILPTSRPPAATATTTPAPFNRNLMPQPMPVPVDDDDGEPNDQGPVPPPGMAPGPQASPVPGVQPYPPGAQPPGQQPVFTAPRPGMVPQPQPQQPGVPNPYAPGARPQNPPGRPPGGGPEGN